MENLHHMNNERREFKGYWLPVEVAQDPRLNWTDRLVFMEIDSFTSRQKDCFFSNEYLAEFVGCTRRTAIRAIVKLRQLGYIEQVRFDGRKRYLRTCFDPSLLTQQSGQKRHSRGDKDDTAGVTTMTPIPVSITSISNTVTSITPDAGETASAAVSKSPDWKSWTDLFEQLHKQATGGMPVQWRTSTGRASRALAALKKIRARMVAVFGEADALPRAAAIVKEWDKLPAYHQRRVNLWEIENDLPALLKLTRPTGKKHVGHKEFGKL